MITDIQLNLNNTALLIMDYQLAIINNYLPIKYTKEVLKNTASLLKSARLAGVKVIYVTLQFQEGHPEVSIRNTTFIEIKKNKLFIENTPEVAIHKDVFPLEDEIIIIKHRMGVFSATCLDMVLKAHDINTLVMAGLITSGVILSTVRQAFDLDYKILVAQNCCADQDEDVHHFLMNKIPPQHSQVLDTKELEKLLIKGV